MAVCRHDLAPGETAAGFPAFFEQTPVIRVQDPLSRFLGVSADGVIDYHYADAVRLAGHSCPTVAGAFLLARAALDALYPDTLPERGGMSIRMPAPETHGTTGVVAQVLTLVTGAAGNGGFQGIGGRFSRCGLLRFAPDTGETDDTVWLRRRDTGATVAARFDMSPVPVDTEQRNRMLAVVEQRADEEQLAAFGKAWQERVRRILLQHADDPAVVQVRSAAPEEYPGY